MSKKLIRFDWAIKRLLRNKVNFVVLEGFLSELLFEDIKIEKILESEGNQETGDDKFNRVDILTSNLKNELIIVEIQNTYEIDYFHRMSYGTAKAISENISLGDEYSKVKKVISVNIVYFDSDGEPLGQGKDYVYKGGVQFEGIHKKDILQLSVRQKNVFQKEKVSDIFPEYHIIKVNKFNDKAKDTLDEWIYFLKNSEVKDSFKAKGLKEANDVLDIMRLSKEQQYGYNRFLDSLHLKASEAFSIKEEADYNARQEEKVETAKIAIEEGFNNETIAKLTKLSIEQIQKIRKENQ